MNITLMRSFSDVKMALVSNLHSITKLRISFLIRVLFYAEIITSPAGFSPVGG
jgi:hypothetical protein